MIPRGDSAQPLRLSSNASVAGLSTQTRGQALNHQVHHQDSTGPKYQQQSPNLVESAICQGVLVDPANAMLRQMKQKTQQSSHNPKVMPSKCQTHSHSGIINRSVAQLLAMLFTLDAKKGS